MQIFAKRDGLYYKMVGKRELRLTKAEMKRAEKMFVVPVKLDATPSRDDGATSSVALDRSLDLV
jgi:hypothetical protein